MSAALLRQATYGTFKIGIYQTLKRLFSKDISTEKLYINVVSGMFSGAVANALASPTDLLKIRMQANHPSIQNKGLFRAIISIAQKEGVRGLWRGVIPNAQRAAVVSGVELSIYDWTKKQFLCRLSGTDTISTHFLCSFVAGFAGAVASTPIDVVRTRLMNQSQLKGQLSNPLSTNYNGAIDCLTKTVKNEGFFALYKGFVPNWLRLGPWNVVFFIAYEQLKKINPRSSNESPLIDKPSTNPA
ncbi:unnamed protein product [Didymodactylos carnosus]|uniref:Uncharacterized protein n=1 Tax=Didymodactylos carnosus TaxID=1234261 RepID=A0A813X3S3_9BILA|nr:unnamed protein product [Didymodactylos carnosus]CAF0988682.1 unnamed protein product [Didymodactylos carnosus]CAF3652044.1 unnamed protein product [Didymodactylos carnosus]CAF3758806.1 unnamed protein product [Didymodactylos carnosus]